MPRLQGLDLHQAYILTERVRDKITGEMDRPEANLRRVACHAVLFDSLIDTLIDLDNEEKKQKKMRSHKKSHKSHHHHQQQQQEQLQQSSSKSQQRQPRATSIKVETN
ncbi:unnamed protein product [Ambrosiozyma monospora]|uniref:Unnamed protein product n=1 Tax=Ambrosiozyma monospora TaxID=43982 RepID=A0A9W6WET7_AMBMO|nr:unnamed protein product [Ambrosiozyma monospora]